MNTIVDEQELFHALDDLGMEPKMIEQLVKSIRLHQWDNGKRILSAHRLKLLTDVHETQDKLYCMDLLIRKLNLSKTRDEKDSTKGVK